MNDNDDYTEIFRLKTKFVTPNAHLTIGIPHGVPGAFSIPPLIRWLYLVQGKRHSHIQYLDELTGKVRIQSPEAALSFARLYTSPRTRGLVWITEISAFAKLGISPRYEVLPLARLDPDFVYGDREMLAGQQRVLRFGGTRQYEGIVNTDVKHKDLQFATVRKERGGFSIRRPLMAAQGSVNGVKPRLVAVDEWVGPSGEFTVEKVTLLDDALVRLLELELDRGGEE